MTTRTYSPSSTSASAKSHRGVGAVLPGVKEQSLKTGEYGIVFSGGSTVATDTLLEGIPIGHVRPISSRLSLFFYCALVVAF